MGGENDDVALGRLLLCPCAGAWAEVSDKLSQCLRTSGIGYHYCMTSDYQMAESIRNPGVTQLSLGVGTAGTIDRTLFPIRR